MNCKDKLVVEALLEQLNTAHNWKVSEISLLIINPVRPNTDLSQTSHCNIKGLSVREVMRIENMITQVQFY